MEKSTAQRLVRDTFKASFDRKRYRDFINEFCNGFDESKAISSMGVPDAFCSHVKSCQRLGTFTAPEGELADVLIVQLTESYKLDRTRTALRDFVAHKLKRGEGSDNSYKEAGLVAFVAPDSQSWRFSYVRMEYETKRDPKTGKIKPEERLTPARRFSYLVGVDEECHTAQTRFLALLQNTSDHPTLSQIEDAFSVESVTKEFFGEYARLFKVTEEALAAVVATDKAIRDDFQAKSVSTVDFAKKLLGQIVFLYFIQKKGWLGVAKGEEWGDGPRNFMRLLADRTITGKQCFFDDVLEPLFYDTLATDRGHDAWCLTFQCRIPFLNGGLFEPLAGYEWEKTKIDLPNTLFTNKQRSPVGDVGTGILDVFDRYNFTVNEAEPLEKEVAIDPEMLGKVFENLIEENRRKGLGAFYTPREIVHYMCQESLINYLDNGLNRPAKSLGEQSIVVPRKDLEDWIRQSDQFAHYAAAITAGTKGDHYPKPPESIRTFAAEIDTLLRDITVCDPAIGSGAFPVGMMTEIVRARLALTPYFNDVAERTPYYFKRHAIQSCLYGADIDVGAVEIAKLRLWLSLVVDEEDVQQIKPLPNLDYKVVVGNSLMGVEKNLFNNEQFKRLEALKPKFFDESNRTKKAEYKQQIEKLIHELTNGREAFDFEIYFSEVFHANGGFDVLIANPPYGAALGKAEKDRLLTLFKHQDYQLDTYLLFFEKAFALSCPTGGLAYIIPNTWLTNLKLRKIRRHAFEDNTVHEIVHYHRQVFEAIVDTEIVIALKGGGRRTHLSVQMHLPGQVVKKMTNYATLTGHSGAPVNIHVSNEEAALAEKLAAKGIPLSQLCKVTAGMKPYQVGKGIPKQTRETVTKREFDAEYKVTPQHRALLRGRDIEQFQIKWSGNRWIKYGKWLAEPRESAGFDSHEKIVIRQTGDSLIAALDDQQFVCMNNMHTIVAISSCPYDLRYILGLLNSTLLNYYFQFLNPEKGEALAEVKKEHVENLPIAKATPAQVSHLVNLVLQIIDAKQIGDTVQIETVSKHINNFVFEIYGLTPTEVSLIEDAS